MNSRNEENNRRPACEVAGSSLGVVVAFCLIAAFVWVFSKSSQAQQLNRRRFLVQSSLTVGGL
jgi:high-affinity Fe2+/Pb2+ permease